MKTTRRIFGNAVDWLPILACLCVASAFTGRSQAAAVNAVPYASLSGAGLIDFNSSAGGAQPGTKYDGVLDLIGASLAERFVGQTLGVSGNSDVLGGTPTGPSLTLLPGAPGQNLNIYEFGGSNILTGLGPVGFPAGDAIGEGAVSILFDLDQSQVGFKYVGGDSGPLNLQFWNRSGALLQSTSAVATGTDYLGFLRQGGVKDIAGVSIYNTDFGGVAYDDIIFDVPAPAQVPDAGGTLGLLSLALVAVLPLRRRLRG